MPDDQAFAAEIVKCLQSLRRGLLAHEAGLSMVTLPGANLGESEVAPLISITSRGRAEHDRLLRLRQVGRQAPLQRVKVPDDGHAHERILPRGVPGAAQSRYVAARCRGSNGARGC